MSWRTWGVYVWGFVAGATLATYVAVSCAPTHAQSPDVAYALEHASAEYGVSLGCLRAIAWRESRFLPQVTNARSGAAGLMQFLPSTWRTLSRWAGYGGASAYDPWSAAHVAAWTISQPWTGGVRHWGGC
jgi:soluble lytic murein transglycosylase-like protein